MNQFVRNWVDDWQPHWQRKLRRGEKERKRDHQSLWKMHFNQMDKHWPLAFPSVHLLPLLTGHSYRFYCLLPADLTTKLRAASFRDLQCTSLVLLPPVLLLLHSIRSSSACPLVELKSIAPICFPSLGGMQITIIPPACLIDDRQPGSQSIRAAAPPRAVNKYWPGMPLFQHDRI